MTEELAHKCMRRAAWLFLIGLVTGAWAGIVMTNGAAINMHLDFHPKHERLVLASHLNALLGTFWLLGVAYTLPKLRLSARGLVWLCVLTTLGAYGNWLITLIASLLDVRGLAFDHDASNNAIAGLLQVGVVIPSFAAAILWVYGLSSRAESH
jgi:hydroxylaminobenzene mutase